MILPLRYYGDPILRAKAKTIDEITPEIVQLADRAIVLYGGRINGEFVDHEINEQRLVAAMLGRRNSGKNEAVA